MHILIAGASGAAGRVLLPLLESRGCTVTGTSSKDMDGLDPRSVKAMLEHTNPDVIVHQMTALKDVQVRNIDKAFHTTNRLRAEGTRNLVEAMRPGTRLIVQSFAGWPYERAGAAVKTEDDPLDPHPPKGVSETHSAILIAESLAVGHSVILLWYGGLPPPR